MLPTMEETLNQAERSALVKKIIELEKVQLYKDPADLLVQIERWGAWLINGSAWLDFDDPTPDDRELGELLTTALALDLEAVYAICRNVVPFVLDGTKPERWTEPGDYDTDKVRASIKWKKMELGIGAKSYEELRVEQEESRRHARAEARKIRQVPRHNHEREMAKQLREDGSSRLQLARSLSAKLKGQPETASGMLCPACKRPSVWFFIEPEQKTSASCNHSNSCGWWGSLFDLARLS
tara:strand:- start:159 stop:875 length:717 start_codon:yes stop_codon:yes gene_type:complete